MERDIGAAERPRQLRQDERQVRPGRRVRIDVDVEHLREHASGEDGRGRSVGVDRPLAQHDEAIGDAHRPVEIVQDHADCAAGARMIPGDLQHVQLVGEILRGDRLV